MHIKNEVENQKQESNKVEEIEVQKNPFFNITDDDRNTICYIVAGEAKGEPIEGKMAVALRRFGNGGSVYLWRGGVLIACGLIIVLVLLVLS